jgi:hypothetical protein
VYRISRYLISFDSICERFTTSNVRKRARRRRFAESKHTAFEHSTHCGCCESIQIKSYEFHLVSNLFFLCIDWLHAVFGSLYVTHLSSFFRNTERNRNGCFCGLSDVDVLSLID